jgi:hypothetical protein
MSHSVQPRHRDHSPVVSERPADSAQLPQDGDRALGGVPRGHGVGEAVRQRGAPTILQTGTRAHCTSRVSCGSIFDRSGSPPAAPEDRKGQKADRFRCSRQRDACLSPPVIRGNEHARSCKFNKAARHSLKQRAAYDPGWLGGSTSQRPLRRRPHWEILLSVSHQSSDPDQLSLLVMDRDKRHVEPHPRSIPPHALDIKHVVWAIVQDAGRCRRLIISSRPEGTRFPEAAERPVLLALCRSA